MTETSCTILAGDYERAGLASQALKEQLKKIGVSPEIVRRVMIAAYEAEMNVVIHANGGVMKSVLDDNQVSVEVSDQGPGIPDIDLALKEGYSTAPPKARQMGFGAGMGLPNIRRNSDRFTIESVAGRGTTLRFCVNVRPQEDAPAPAGALRGLAGLCTGCLRCLHICPTRALRVRRDAPQILAHLCVDCTSCMSVCPVQALALEGEAQIEPGPDNRLVLPPGFLAQFSPAWPARDVLAGLGELGFSQVTVTDAAEHALRQAVLEYAREIRGQEIRGPIPDFPGTSKSVAEPGAGNPVSVPEFPVLSPVCPAVLNLIQTKFPSLIKNVAPFLNPLEAVREDLAGRRATFVVLCPAQKTLIGQGRGPARAHVVLPSQLESRIRPRLGRPARGAADESGLPAQDPGILRVGGMAHVVRVLEDIENGRMLDDAVVELYACDEGCFGSPLLREDPFLSRRRWGRPALAGPPAKARRRERPHRPRPGLRLDANMARAIQKLSQINGVLATLPGKDCGACGCPTCAALAEDVVLGRTQLHCPRAQEAGR